MRSRCSGFSLLEVMIALAIFALAAVVLGGAYLNVLQGYELSNRALLRNENLRFAREALLIESDLEVVEKGGEFDAGNNARVRWKAKVEPTETPDVFEVVFDCEVNSPELRQPERTTEVFRLLRPTWSKADEREKLRMETRERITKILTLNKP